METKDEDNFEDEEVEEVEEGERSCLNGLI